MKNFSKITLGALIIALASLTSCSNDDDNHVDHDHDHDAEEHTYVRILLSDEKTTQLTLVNPVDATSSFFNAKF